MKSKPSSSPFYVLVDRLADLYVSYRGRYIEARNNNGHPSVYIPHKKNEVKPLSNAALIAHMRRRVAVGVYAGTRSSKFVTFDVDLPDPEVVRKVVRGLEDVGFRHEDIHISSSGGKGYHVEIFFDGLMFTDDLRALYNHVVAAEHLDTRKVEFRPTHAQAIKLPLSRHHKTGNMCWFLDRDTLEPIESADYLLGIVPVSRDHAAALIHARCRPADLRVVDAASAAAKPKPEIAQLVGDGCPQMAGPGTRHNMMVAIAIRSRYAGKTEEEIRHELADWVAQQNPDFITDSARVVGDDIDGLAHWVWSPSFRMAGAKEVRLTADEFRAILSCGRGMRRRILFLFTLFCKRFGSVRMAAERVAAYVGGAPVSVWRNVRDLQAAGFVTAHQGARYRANGHMASEPNSYEVHLATPPAGGGESFAPSPSCEPFTASWDWTPETFNDVWASAIAALTTEAQRAQLFTQHELAALASAEASRIKTTGGMKTHGNQRTS